MNKLKPKYSSFKGLVIKLGNYIEAITFLPPQGEYAKQQVKKEVEDLFKQLDGQSKALKNALMGAIGGSN